MLMLQEIGAGVQRLGVHLRKPVWSLRNCITISEMLISSQVTMPVLSFIMKGHEGKSFIRRCEI